MSDTTRPSKSPANKAVLTVALTVFVDIMGFAIIIPLVALYGRMYGATTEQQALLGCIYSLMQLCFAPLWGSISDRIGRRRVILFSILGGALANFGFGLATNFAHLFAARALAGMFAANIATAQACAADLSNPANRAKHMGIIGAAIGLGFTLGPPIGGLSAKYLGLQYPGIIAGTICILNLLMALRYLPETKKPSPVDTSSINTSSINTSSIEIVPPHPKATTSESCRPSSLSCIVPAVTARLIRLSKLHAILVILIAVFFFTTCAFSQMEQVFSLLLQDTLRFDISDASLYSSLMMLAMGMVSITIQGRFIHRLVLRFGETRLLKIGLLIAAIGMLSFSQSFSLTTFTVAALLIATGGALLNPSLNSLISKHAYRNADGDSLQGLTFGLAQSAGSLARTIGPFTGIYTYYSLSSLAPFAIASLLYFVAFILIKSIK